MRRQQVADAIAVVRQVWTGTTETLDLATEQLGRGSGFLVPDPAPPIIVAGFGPRMAALAGSWADGFNTHAGQPRLAELIEVARAAHRGRETTFEVSGFAGLDERWLDRSAGLDRLIMVVSPNDGAEAIARFASTAGLEPAG